MTDPLSRNRINTSKGEKKPLPHGWTVVVSKSYPDRVYYYNKVTRCSTWENPCSFFQNNTEAPGGPKQHDSQVNPSTSNNQPKISGSASSFSNRSLDDDDNSMLIDEDIEEYDEDHNDYFDNVPMNNFSLRRSDISSPPNSPEDIYPKPTTPVSKIISIKEPKELWTRFLNSSAPRTNPVKRSLVLSDLDSTVKKMKAEENKKPEKNKVVYSKVVEDFDKSNKNFKSPPRKDPLRFSKSDKNDPKFKKTTENSFLAKKIPKLSKVLGDQVYETRNSSPLCDIYKLGLTTPAQTRLAKIRQENLEAAQKNVKPSIVLNEQSRGSLQERLETAQRNSKPSKVLNEQPSNNDRGSLPGIRTEAAPKNSKPSMVLNEQPNGRGSLQGILETAQRNSKQSKVLNEQSSNNARCSVQGRFTRIREEFVKNSGKLKINAKEDLNDDCAGVVKKKKKIHFVGETRTEFHPTEPLTGTPFNDEPEEEMEWEPCDEQEIIEHINHIRKNFPKEKVLLSHILIRGQPSGNSGNPESLSWIVVLDTNILLSSLNFIKDLRDTKINDVGYPIIYIPWRVLQELDHLKDSPQLKVAARRAISYINENFISSHPRFRGQSFQEFRAMAKSESELPDDDILQTCFHLQKEAADKKLILLTNDKNLESKAILSGVKSYSKERFLKEMGFSKDKSDNVVRNSDNNNDNNNRLSSVSAEQGTLVEENDAMLCELKAILKKSLIYVIETELKLAYGDAWKKMVKDRDWSLQGLIGCFLKFWRSVFYLVFPKETLERVENLKKAFRNENLGQRDEVKSTVIISQELLFYIKRCKEIRPYMDLVDTSLKDLDLLLNPKLPVTENLEASQANSTNDTAVETIIKSEPIDYIDTRICDSQSHIEKIRNIFREIWNFVRNVWNSLKKSLASNGSDKSALLTIKTELPAVCRNLEELIVSLEKVTLLSLPDICETDQFIIDLTEILVKFGSSVNQSFYEIYFSDDLRYSVGVFCGDAGGRTLLDTSLSDFKEFYSELVKGYEYLQNIS